jgi:hypothetical protein
MMKVVPTILFALVLFITQARATSFVSETYICPIGGQKFVASAVSSYSISYDLPDGTPIGPGTGTVFFEPPVCPKNELVMYRKFSRAEKSVLKNFIKSDIYREAIVRDTLYYRAYLIERAVNPFSAKLPWLLLTATWEAKEGDGFRSPRTIRYQREFRAFVANLAIDNKSFTSIALRARAMNAARELSEFESAEKERAAIKIDPEAGGTDGPAKKSRESWSEYLEAIKAVIARRDSSRAPIDMIEVGDILDLCSGKTLYPYDSRFPTDSLTPFELEYCKNPGIVKALEGSQR